MSTLFKTLIVTSMLAISTNEGEKTTYLSDQTKLDYSVSYDKVLNGAYTLTTPDEKMSLRGVYKDDQRVGNWYAFNPDGSIFLRYNYDLKKLVSIDNNAIKRVKFDIPSEKKFDAADATIAVPICSIEQFISLVGSEFERKMRQENKSAEGSLSVDLTAFVDAEGNARYNANYVLDGINLSKKLIIKEKMFNIDWLPATYKKEKIASTFTVNMLLNFTADPTKRQRFVWNY